jgi:uncharacterized membrane protein
VKQTIHHHVSKVLEHKIVQTLIYVKGIIGVLEALAGIIMLMIGPNTLSRFVGLLFDYDLEDKENFVSKFLYDAANNLSMRMHIFIALYMIVHGIVFIAVVFALIYKKIWAFPIAGTMLGLFIIYQIRELSRAFSLTMMILTIVDILLLILLTFEYIRLRKNKKNL